MVNADIGMRFDAPRDKIAECRTVDRERPAGGDGCRVRCRHDEGMQPPHFLLEDTDGIFKSCAAQGVAAYEFGKAVRLMGG